MLFYLKDFFKFHKEIVFSFELIDFLIFESQDVLQEYCWKTEASLNYSLIVTFTIFICAFLDYIYDFLPQTMMFHMCCYLKFNVPKIRKGMWPIPKYCWLHLMDLPYKCSLYNFQFININNKIFLFFIEYLRSSLAFLDQFLYFLSMLIVLYEILNNFFLKLFQTFILLSDRFLPL